MWRISGDIADSWDSMMAIADRQVGLHPFAGPDHWNDPDMLEVGNGGMSDDEYRTHFALWAMLAAPLMAGNDIRSMSASTRAILAAREVIAVDQDPLGKQAHRVRTGADGEVWARPLADGSTAVLLLNRGDASSRVGVGWEDVELGPKVRSARVRDLWNRSEVGARVDGYDTTLPPHGAALLKVIPS
jgi:alpha-galactosidase